MANSFLGSLDEVAVYNTALSATRLRQHYQTGIGIPGRYADEILADTPRGYWRLSEAKTGVVAADVSGNGKNGTYTATNVTYLQTGALHLQDINDPDAYNQLAIYFREMPLDENTALDLDGRTMAQLDALNAQPDYGTALYANRTQADLNIETQQSIDGDTQFDIERIPDYTSEAWVEVKLIWRKPVALGGIPNNNAQGVLTIKNANGAGYTFEDVVLDAANAEDGGYDYVMVADLEDTTIRVRIYKTDAVGNIKGVLSLTPTVYGPFALVYDTGPLQDAQVFARRKGRFGWWANFQDGDAAVKYVATRGITYASARTQEFKSDTPVDGAQLFVSATTPKSLITTISDAPWGGTVDAAPQKTNTGKAYAIKCVSGVPLQGFQTNSFVLDDPSNTVASFDLFFPGTQTDTPGQSLSAFLYGDLGQVVPLRLTFQNDKWVQVRFDLTNELVPPGAYRLIVVLDMAAADTTWYVDNLDVSAKAITWKGRGQRPDAWGMDVSNWVSFDKTLNKSEGGTLFDRRGSGIQVCADARRQDARVESFKVVPKYAELGRFMWTDQIETLTNPPNWGGGVTTSTSGRTVTFTSSAVPNAYPLVNTYWQFSDGTTAIGSRVTKTFTFPGTYSWQATAVDAKGQRSSTTGSVTV